MRLGQVTAAFFLVCFSSADAEQLTIAVASNFRVVAEEIATRFKERTGHEVRISSASTGKLYAQIINGAPFGVLLAADAEHPRRLEEAGLGVVGTRFTYAIGGLVLWSQSAAYAGADCRAGLADLGRHRLAIANPLTAPYGIAAKEYLLSEGLWSAVEPALVYGENISQALLFVVSGNAELGLIARSQADDSRLPDATCNWPVPGDKHAPIEQQAIQLNRNDQATAAAAFLTYLGGDDSRTLISEHGYTIPQ